MYILIYLFIPLLLHFNFAFDRFPKTNILHHAHLTSIYLFKVNNRETRTASKICSKLIIKTPERYQCCCDVFIVKFEQIH